MSRSPGSFRRGILQRVAKDSQVYGGGHFLNRGNFEDVRDILYYFRARLYLICNDPFTTLNTVILATATMLKSSPPDEYQCYYNKTPEINLELDNCLSQAA